MKHLYKSIAGLLLTMFLTQSNAADLIVVCSVKEVAKNQTPSTYKRKYEIDFEPRFFKSSVDMGNGFRHSEDGFPKDINASRVVFAEDGTTSQYFDRQTSQYVYKNVASEVEATGSCTQETRPKK